MLIISSLRRGVATARSVETALHRQATSTKNTATNSTIRQYRSNNNHRSPSSTKQQQPLYKKKKTTTKRNRSTLEPATVAQQAETTTTDVVPPSRLQLSRIFWHAVVPMVGFGFTDQTIMIQAGHAIDCTLGVTFGMSTLTAAAFGQVCSDASGVLFGGTLESLAQKAGLPRANLTAAQRPLRIVKRVRLAGSFFGVIAGCMLGLVNLLFIDTSRSSSLKLQAWNDEQEFEFHIEASNAIRDDATALTVSGPDVDGLLASMTAALAVRGCSLVELHASRGGQEDGSNNNNQIQDVFYVVSRDTKLPFDDDELEGLAKNLLDATKTPMNVTSVHAAMQELEITNTQLRARIHTLEEALYEEQITVVPSTDK